MFLFSKIYGWKTLPTSKSWGVAVGSNLEQKSVSEKQSHSGSCWEKFKTTRRIYIYIYTCHCHCVFSWFLYKGHLYISHYFDETCYRTINIIWEQHHADFNTPNLPKILPQSWRIALSILVAGLQLMHALFQKRPSNFTSFHNAKTRTTWSPIASKHQVLTVRIHFNTGNAQTLNLLHSLQSLLPVQQKVKGIWKESSRHDYKQGWQQTA